VRVGEGGVTTMGAIRGSRGFVMRAQFQGKINVVAGSGLSVGRHAGEPVTDDYPGESPLEFTGGNLKLVSVNVSGEPYVDLERHAEMLLKSQ
jgi:hypothetical protein